jgi:hypothetical protein
MVKLKPIEYDANKDDIRFARKLHQANKNRLKFKSDSRRFVYWSNECWRLINKQQERAAKKVRKPNNKKIWIGSNYIYKHILTDQILNELNKDLLIGLNESLKIKVFYH